MTLCPAGNLLILTSSTKLLPDASMYHEYLKIFTFKDSGIAKPTNTAIIDWSEPNIWIPLSKHNIVRIVETIFARVFHSQIESTQNVYYSQIFRAISIRTCISMIVYKFCMTWIQNVSISCTIGVSVCTQLVWIWCVRECMHIMHVFVNMLRHLLYLKCSSVIHED